MNDCMVDLETLGTDTDCVVLSIGATFFDINTKKLGTSFYAVLEINEQLCKGRQVSGDTIKWWIQQSGAAQGVFCDYGAPVKKTLQEFYDWYKKGNIDGAYIWGNGSSFDISILEDLFRDYGIQCPWEFWKPMDLRTFKRFKAPGAKVIKIGIDHNALDDAVAQAKFVMENS